MKNEIETKRASKKGEAANLLVQFALIMANECNERKRITQPMINEIE